MIIKSTFKPAWWLLNKHLQTIFRNSCTRKKPNIDKSERLELNDGDFIDLSWAINGLDTNTPLVILLHGLGGNLNSSYVEGQLSAYNNHGFRAVLMHFRGASEEPNRLAKTYHSGETNDLDFLLKILHEREPNTKKAVVGISLGGNVLLKWLGEVGSQSLIHASIAVSPPFELALLADYMNKGFSRLYQYYLIKKLRKIFKNKFEKYPEMLATYIKSTETATSFWQFDELITAPLNGFLNAKSYYQQSSSRQYLSNIKTPTLILHSIDDPFMPSIAIPTEQELSSQVTLELSSKGGHVGFIGGRIPGRPIYWLEKRIPEFLKHSLDFL
jgi:predicted alpha/beta-fold hydrolase